MPTNRVAKVSNGKRAIHPGGELLPSHITDRIKIEGGEEAIKVWFHVTSDNVWGSVLGQADLPQVEEYCIHASMKYNLDKSLKTDPELDTGKYRYLSKSQQLSLHAKASTLMQRAQIDFSRRVQIHASNDHVENVKQPNSTPKQPEVPWATGQLQ